jgi:hypothetical protein
MMNRPSRGGGGAPTTPPAANLDWAKPVLGVLGIGLIGFLVLNPRLRNNVGHTFEVKNQNTMFDTARQMKRVHLDSLKPLLQVVQAQLGQNCPVVLETEGKMLRISVENTACDRSFNTTYTGNIALNDYFKMKNSPIKAVSRGYGFETPIDTGRFVLLPVDILKSVVDAADGQTGKAYGATKAVSPKSKPKGKKQ